MRNTIDTYNKWKDELTMKEYLLPKSGQFYKANLHCHTIMSDGLKTPEEIKKYIWIWAIQ